MHELLLYRDTGPHIGEEREGVHGDGNDSLLYSLSASYKYLLFVLFSFLFADLEC